MLHPPPSSTLFPYTTLFRSLPRVIPKFRERFPKVHLILSEGSPPHLAQMVRYERADVAIATETLAETPGLVALPVYPWQHTVVVAPDHPLADLPANRASRSEEHTSELQSR